MVTLLLPSSQELQMNRLAILGAGGHGNVIADCAEQCGWNDIVFFDDNWRHIKSKNYTVGGDSQNLFSNLSDYQGVVVAIGNNKTRFDMLNSLQKHHAPLVSIIHPSACISKYAKLGFGIVIMPGAIVNTGAIIECGVILNTGCSVDHDCVLGRCVHLSPGARLAGGVKIKERSWIGIGATVNEGVTLGSDVIVAAGAAVISNIHDGLKVAGVPARSI